MGETTVMSNPSVYDSLGGNNACEILLDEPTHQTSLQFVNNEKNNLKLSFQNISSHKKLKREHRSTLFTYLNGDEAQSLGFENYIIMTRQIILDLKFMIFQISVQKKLLKTEVI